MRHHHRLSVLLDVYFLLLIKMTCRLDWINDCQIFFRPPALSASPQHCVYESLTKTVKLCTFTVDVSTPSALFRCSLIRSVAAAAAADHQFVLVCIFSFVECVGSAGPTGIDASSTSSQPARQCDQDAGRRPDVNAGEQYVLLLYQLTFARSNL